MDYLILGVSLTALIVVGFVERALHKKIRDDEDN